MSNLCENVKNRIQDLFVKLQVTGDKDEYEAPTKDDVIRLNVDYQFQATPEEIEREFLKSSYTPEGNLSGIKIGTMGGQSEMYGADYSDGVTKPWMHPYLLACGLVDTKVQSLVCAVTTDAIHDEILTGGTSGAELRVIVPTESTDTKVHIIVVSGVPEATGETFNGSEGAVIVTSNDTLTDEGWSYQFSTSACEHLSTRSEIDGFKSEMFNGIPTVQFSAESGKIPHMIWEIAGVINHDGADFVWMKNATGTADIVRDPKAPDLYVDARALENDFQPVIDGTTLVDLGIVRSILPNANAVSGVEGYNVTGRKSIYNRRIGIPQNSDLDVFKETFDANTVKSQTRMGQNQYNTFWHFVRAGRFNPTTVEDQDGNAKYALSSVMTGQDDAEYELVCI